MNANVRVIRVFGKRHHLCCYFQSKTNSRLLSTTSPLKTDDLRNSIASALNEPTFASLGLAAKTTPAGWFQAILENIHVGLDIPWWGTIALSIYIIRIAKARMDLVSHLNFSYLCNANMRATSVTPLCPLCNRVMVHKANRRGVFFYGCPTWPNCNGSRKPDGTHPGPVVLIKKERALYGDAWAALEELRMQGKVAFR